MNVELVFRFVGAALFALGGWYLGADVTSPFAFPVWLRLEYVGATLGLVVGFVGAPYMSTHPARIVVEQARRLHVKDLAAALFGLVVALVLSALMAIPLSDLPGILGKILPFAGCLFMMYI